MAYYPQWYKDNRDRRNARRRELRAARKIASLQGKRCLNCDILMVERCKGVRVYCASCVKNYPDEVRRHRWRRYYYRLKHGMIKGYGEETHQVRY